ncbi:MAG: putative bifunctional diguanylate cyclase/phosphodiesterase, partial [Chroococcales cyanobacterium]
ESDSNSPFSLTSQVYQIPDLYQEPKIGGIAYVFKLTPIRSLLIIPLRYHQQCIGCLTLFRHEIETETLWAGRNHPDSRNSLPRQSFEAWREVVRGQALPWRADEIKLARTLGIHLYTAVMERRLKEMILHHSYHDSLTGLPNRLLFHERLSLALANIQLTPGEVLAVIFLDLDGFKTINDTLGHAVGDELLKRVAERLINLLNIDDTIARWGGDEFTILLSSLPNVEKASTIALKILAALSVPFHFHEQELYIKGSLGIAIAPYHGNDAETLLKHADAALHGAKQQGRNTYQLYNTAIGSKVEKRLAIENNLYKAIEREEFILYYQPQFCLKTGKIVGVEALIRWQSRELGFVSPAQFIPLAEETGAIIPIGEWVLQTACLQHRYWQELGLSPIQVAINLSGRQFQDQRLLKMIQRVLETTGMNPNYLEFEITESIAIQDTGLTISILNKLRELGVQTSIDDFGTGYSSLSSLKHFPLDKIKIDQSFIRDLTTDSHDAAIVRAVVALGHGLDLKVVAEGVETEEQYQFLKSLKCNVVQGYYLSRPLAAQMITSLLLEKQGKLEKSQSK